MSLEFRRCDSTPATAAYLHGGWRFRPGVPGAERRRKASPQEKETERRMGVSMTLALILSVGEDSALLESRSSILRAVGYAVETELSVRRAMQRFIDGDFDLVLLCHSIPPEDRARLISAIRASGSRTPLVFVAAHESQIPDADADATVGSAPPELLRGIEEILLTVGKRSVQRESRFSSLTRCELPMNASAIAAKMRSPERPRHN